MGLYIQRSEKEYFNYGMVAIRFDWHIIAEWWRLYSERTDGVSIGETWQRPKFLRWTPATIRKWGYFCGKHDHRSQTHICLFRNRYLFACAVNAWLGVDFFLVDARFSAGGYCALLYAYQGLEFHINGWPFLFLRKHWWGGMYHSLPDCRTGTNWPLFSRSGH